MSDQSTLSDRLDSIRAQVERLSDDDVDALFAGTLFGIELGMVSWLHEPGHDKALWGEVQRVAQTNPPIAKIVKGTQLLTKFLPCRYWEVATVAHEVLAERGKMPTAVARTGLRGKIKNLRGKFAKR